MRSCLSVYMVTILLFGVSGPVPPPAAVAPDDTGAPSPPKPSASASCSRFFFLVYMANMSAPTIITAASMPIIINTVELVPPEPESVTGEPLLPDCDVAHPTMLLSLSIDVPVGDDEILLSSSIDPDLKLFVLLEPEAPKYVDEDVESNEELVGEASGNEPAVL